MSDNAKQLVVIGAGLPRTGTLTQKVALETLLGGKCYHMETVGRKRHEEIDRWLEAVRHGLTEKAAHEILDGFTACTDYPPSHFYKDLMRYYPNAKVLLSVRDPKSWAVSVSSTLFQMVRTVQTVPNWFMSLLGMSNFLPAVDGMFVQELGADYWDLTEQQLIDKFEQHNAEVRRHVPPERLLEFRVADGWRPLCEFLQLPVPDQPFPRVNDMAIMKKRLTGLRLVSWCLRGFEILAVVGCVAAGVFAARRWGQLTS